ncbi:MAG: hypothetical protein HWE07_16030, partial [Cytophagia bacterium]|nr:hypothetical protein [Cytophagia bacterium]
TFEEAKARMDQRKGHFMPSSLIQSQLDSLEIPTEAIRFSATTELGELVHLLEQNFRKLL